MKYNKNLFESIKESLKESSKKNESSGFKDFLKLEKDKVYIVRLLPNIKDFNKTFFHYYSHTWLSRLDQSVVNIFCPNSYSERCPVDEYRSKIWKTNDEEKRAEIKDLKRNENWLVNVYVVKDPTNPENEGKVKILRYGKQLNKIIDNAINGDESDEFGHRIFDLTGDGCNLKIKVETNEGGYATYVASRFQSPSEIESISDPDEVYDQVQELDNIFTHQSYDEIQTTLNKHWLCKIDDEFKTAESSSSKVENTETTDTVLTESKDRDKELDDLIKDL
jgi:hypothetical protein